MYYPDFPPEKQSSNKESARKGSNGWKTEWISKVRDEGRNESRRKISSPECFYLWSELNSNQKEPFIQLFPLLCATSPLLADNQRILMKSLPLAI